MRFCQNFIAKSLEHPLRVGLACHPRTSFSFGKKMSTYRTAALARVRKHALGGSIY
jgi:hypothetical protein